MVSTYTSNLRLDLQGTGDNNGTWGTVANTDFSLIDDSIAGYVKVSVSGGDTALSTNNGSSDNARKAMIEIVGSPTSTANVIIPANSKQYIVRCSLSNSTTALVKISGTTGYTLTNGANQYVITDGTTVTGESVNTSSGVVAGSYSLPLLSVNGFGIVTSISTLASVGIAVQTSSGPVVRRVSAGSGVTVTNPDGASGDFIIGLSASGVTSATYGNPRSLDVNSFGQITSVVSATAPRSYVHHTGILSTLVTCATVIPYDNTIPQSSEGTEFYTCTVTPMSGSSTIVIEANVQIGTQGATDAAVAVFKDSATDASFSTFKELSANTTSPFPTSFSVAYSEASGSTSQRVYKFRAGPKDLVYSIGINGTPPNTKVGGGTVTSFFKVTELI